MVLTTMFMLMIVFILHDEDQHGHTDAAGSSGAGAGSAVGGGGGGGGGGGAGGGGGGAGAGAGAGAAADAAAAAGAASGACGGRDDLHFIGDSRQSLRLWLSAVGSRSSLLKSPRHLLLLLKLLQTWRLLTASCQPSTVCRPTK